MSKLADHLNNILEDVINKNISVKDVIALKNKLTEVVKIEKKKNQLKKCYSKE